MGGICLPHRIGDLESNEILKKAEAILPHRIGDLENDRAYHAN